MSLRRYRFHSWTFGILFLATVHISKKLFLRGLEAARFLTFDVSILS